MPWRPPEAQQACPVVTRYCPIMVILDRLIFLQLQKTGCSYVQDVLQECLGAKVFGKHNRLNRLTEKSDAPIPSVIAGGIRNPWDWYLSLWGFGCQNEGGAFKRQTRSHKRASFTRIPDIPKQRVGAVTSERMECEREHDPLRWSRLYSDVRDATLFREWLYEIHEPRSRFSAFPDFGYSTIWPFAGLYTYLYCYLYLRDLAALFDGSMQSMDDVFAPHRNGRAANCFLRTETITDDLIRMLKDVGYLSRGDSLESRIRSFAATNVSSRSRDLDHFYDKAAYDYVSQRDGLIVSVFGY